MMHQQREQPQGYNLSLEELYQIIGELEIMRRKQAAVIVELQRELTALREKEAVPSQ